MSRHQKFAGRLIAVTSDPASPVQGDEWLNTTKNAWVRYNGSANVAVNLAVTTTSTSSSTSTTTTSTSTSTTTTSTSTTTTSTSSSTTTT